MGCVAPGPGSPLLPALADYLDCHAQSLGRDGAQALVGGTVVPTLLTSCLVIYVALIGYRLMLGQTFGARDAVLSIARIALVITFCTSWPSYETVIYRVGVEGPSEVASAILKPSGLPALTLSDMAQRLQRAYDAVGSKSASDGSSASKISSSDPRALASIFPANPTGFTSSAPQQQGAGAGGVLFMVSSVGALLTVRLGGALVLAVGPLIIALALFDSFLGLFEGWVRALFAAALAGMGLMVIVTLELTFVEAQLWGQGANDSAPFTAQNLMVVAALFTLIEVGVVIAAGLVASGFKLPRWRDPLRRGLEAFSSLPMRLEGPAQSQDASSGSAPPSRAQSVADAVSVQGQRERTRSAGELGMSQSSAPLSRFSSRMRGSNDQEGAPQGLGPTLRRNALSRRSPNIVRRNERG